MKAVYDLSKSSPTWDFAIALARMDMERRQRGEDRIDLSIAPGPIHGFREDPFPPVEPEAREALLESIVLPLAKYLPAIRSVERLEGRDGLDGYGAGEFLISLGHQMEVLNDEGGRCLEIPWEPEDGLITITLRECPYYEDRNSDLSAWLEAAHRLQKQGLRVVFVRDTEKADEPLLGFETCPEASRSLDARAALYARAEVNAFVVNGPVALALLANLPCLVFWKSGEGHYATSREYYEAHGFPVYGQYPNSPPWQRLAWRPETADNIVEEIEALRKVDRSWRKPKGLHRFSLDGSLNHAAEQIRAHVLVNSHRDIPQMEIFRPRETELCVCGGGPSLEAHLDDLKERYESGTKVVAMNGTHDWLIERGIEPSLYVLLDAREFNTRFVRKPIEKCQYLIASQCHPFVFDALLEKGARVRIWHAHDGSDDEIKQTLDARYDSWIPVVGGSSVMLRTFPLLYLLGLRGGYHVYGFDSCLQKGHHHAYDQPENDAMVTQVQCAGRWFSCHAWMAGQAQEFMQLTRHHGDKWRLNVIGDGLIAHIIRHGAEEFERRQAA